MCCGKLDEVGENQKLTDLEMGVGTNQAPTRRNQDGARSVKKVSQSNTKLTGLSAVYN
jgi:hypothetical protein